MTTRFVIENVEAPNTGVLVPAVVKYSAVPNGGEARDEWTTIPDLDRLFETCTRRWPAGWDLEKLITCVNECEFD